MLSESVDNQVTKWGLHYDENLWKIATLAKQSDARNVQYKMGQCITNVRDAVYSKKQWLCLFSLNYAD